MYFTEHTYQISLQRGLQSQKLAIIMSSCWMDGWPRNCLIPGRCRMFSLLPSIETSSWAYTTSYSMGNGSHFLGSKQFDYIDIYCLNNAFYVMSDRAQLKKLFW